MENSNDAFDFAKFDYFFDFKSFFALSPGKPIFKSKFRCLEGVRVYASGECCAYGLLVKCRPSWCKPFPRERNMLGVFTYPSLSGLTKQEAEYVSGLRKGFLREGRTYYMKGRFFIDITDDV